MYRSSKFFTLFLALPILACCGKMQEEVEPVGPQPSQLQKVPLTFTASAFKTALGPDDSVLWQEGDAITIYDGVENCKFATSGSGASVTFEGEARDTGSWIAVYPYFQSTQVTDGDIVTYVKSAQYSAPGTFGARRGLAVCEISSDKTVTMRNALGLMEFKLTDSDITSVTIMGNGGEILAGECSINMKDGVPSLDFT